MWPARRQLSYPCWDGLAQLLERLLQKHGGSDLVRRLAEVLGPFGRHLHVRHGLDPPVRMDSATCASITCSSGDAKSLLPRDARTVKPTARFVGSGSHARSIAHWARSHQRSRRSLSALAWVARVDVTSATTAVASTPTRARTPTASVAKAAASQPVPGNAATTVLTSRGYPCTLRRRNPAGPPTPVRARGSGVVRPAPRRRGGTVVSLPPKVHGIRAWLGGWAACREDW